MSVRHVSSCTFFILFLLSNKAGILASPLPRSNVEARYIANCTDLGAKFDPSCWYTLDLSDYLVHPTTGWIFTTPQCLGHDDGHDCCLEGELWSICYLRLAHGFDGDDCSEINTQSCSYDPTMAVDPRIAPEVRYVMRNIYSINNFFTIWWEALSWAIPQAALIVPSVIHELDPEKKTNYLLVDMLVAVTVGLAYISEPEVAIGISGLAAGVLQMGQYMMVGLKEAPLIGRTMWPKGTVDSQIVQIGIVQTELANISKEIGTMLNAGLETIMSDAPTFAEFASYGQFSGSTKFSIPENTAGLDMALKTFIVSDAMTQNDWTTYPRLWMTRDDLTSGSTGPGCSFGPENYDICANSTVPNVATYYSNYTQRAYSLVSKGTELTARQLMLDIVDNQWSTLGALFDGAFNCTAAGNAPSSNPFNIFINGTIDLSCVSQLKICSPCNEVCQVPLINGTCPIPPCQDTCDS